MSWPGNQYVDDEDLQIKLSKWICNTFNMAYACAYVDQRSDDINQADIERAIIFDVEINDLADIETTDTVLRKLSHYVNSFISDDVVPVFHNAILQFIWNETHGNPMPVHLATGGEPIDFRGYKQNTLENFFLNAVLNSFMYSFICIVSQLQSFTGRMVDIDYAKAALAVIMSPRNVNDYGMYREMKDVGVQATKGIRSEYPELVRETMTLTSNLFGGKNSNLGWIDTEFVPIVRDTIKQYVEFIDDDVIVFICGIIKRLIYNNRNNKAFNNFPIMMIQLGIDYDQIRNEYQDIALLEMYEAVADEFDPSEIGPFRNILFAKGTRGFFV